MERNIFSLPPEVLIYIFEYLDVRHRLIVGQVCKKWLDATNCDLLLKNVNLVISPMNRNALKKFPCLTRQFKCFTFYQIQIDSFFYQFLKQYSEHFISLSFIECQMDKYHFYLFTEERIPSCDNLQYLKVKNCGAYALFKSFPSVTTLEIDAGFDLADKDLYEMDKSFPNLVTLKIANHVAWDPRAYKRFYNRGLNGEITPSFSILTFPTVRNFIAKRSKTLVSLDLSRTGMTPAALGEISKINNLRLQTMLFSHDLSGSRIESFCRNQPALTSLNLSTVLTLSDERLTKICQILVNLRELVVVFKHKINASIKDVFKLQHLQKLNLNFCSNITPFSFQEALSNPKVFNLKDLNLAFTKIGDLALRKLLSLNKDIEHLDLTFTDISSTTLHLICKSLPRLKSLILNSCKCLSDSGLTGQHDCYSLTSECFSPETCVPLSNLKELRKLDLSRNSRITGYSCIQSIRFIHLEVLKLIDCELVDSEVASNLLMLNPSLKEVQLSLD